MNLSGISVERTLLLALTASLLVLMLSSGALAQSVPSASQYESGQGARSCPAGTASVQPDTGADLAAEGGQVSASVGDGPCAAADNVGQGTAAVNDALTGTTSSASAASAPGETPVPPKDVASKSIKPAPDGTSASPGGAASGRGVDEDETATKDETANGEAASAGEGLASITELPKTGGAPPIMLLSGAMLVALGLAIRMTF